MASSSIAPFVELNPIGDQSSSSSKEIDASESQKQLVESTLTPEQVENQLEDNKGTIDGEQSISRTPSSTLNPDAKPFFAPATNQNTHSDSASSGEETDDENDTNESSHHSGVSRSSHPQPG